MSELLTSWYIILLAAGMGFVFLLISVLSGNIHWVPRGLTPPSVVTTLQHHHYWQWARRGLPRTKRGWIWFIAILVVILICWWSWHHWEGAGTTATSGGANTVMPKPTDVSPSFFDSLPKPSVEGVKVWARTNWLLVLIVASTLYLAASLRGRSSAKGFRSAIVLTVLMLWFGLGFGQSLFEGYQWYAGGAQLAALGNPTPSVPTMVLTSYGSQSSRIYLPKGKRISFNGSGFRTHCVYPYGPEGIVGDPVHSCRDGFEFVYLENLVNGKNTITYEFTN